MKLQLKNIGILFASALLTLSCKDTANEAKVMDDRQAVIDSMNIEMAKQKAEIDDAARDIAIVMAPNMAVGVNVVFKLLAQAAKALKEGYDIEMTAAVSDAVKIPVVASGGAGSPQHMLDVLTAGKADAALAASIFHFKEHSVPAVKQFLADHGVPIRLV